MLAKRLLISGTVVFFAAGALFLAGRENAPPSGVKMTAAAQEFLETLTPKQRSQATFTYDSDERLNWHYIPRERKGVPLKDLEGDARRAFHKLVQSGLSEQGYAQALDVMSLEEVLYLLEEGDRETRRRRRDPEKYYISIFGKPSVKGTWGWRIEGHHLSLNFTVIDGDVTASTPEFFGANPALIDAGPGRKIRVLGPEEDIARQILLLCDKKRSKLMYRSPKAPDDIRSRGTKQPETTPPVGLPVSKMSKAQKKLMIRLLKEYLQNMPADVAAERRKAIHKAGLEKVHIAWWGSHKPNERHAYRIQGPTFLVEYNNTQNSANHLHTIWRNMAGDFNVPIEK